MSDISDILRGMNIEIAESLLLPARDAIYHPVPVDLHAQVRKQLEQLYPAGIYRHQAIAIQYLIKGHDICLATSTASGKTAVFTSFAAHKILSSNKDSKILAIYPAKALIEDQELRWRELFEPMGLQVGVIHGGRPMKEREEILASSDAVLITPDVVHAWLLGNISQFYDFVSRISLVILDEAHIYNGAFGTYTAYLMRRLGVHLSSHQFITSTATIANASSFIETLIGRSPLIISTDLEGAPKPERKIHITDASTTDTLELGTRLVKQLARQYDGRFIVFVDSRQAVERVSIDASDLLGIESDKIKRKKHNDVHPLDRLDDNDEEEITATINRSEEHLVMPYRAGYEESDRAEIQRSLSNGKLRGVVSTSALEVGIDIGDLDLVVLLNTPATHQSFMQRIGRAGRRDRRGECLVLDTKQTIISVGLDTYLHQPSEPNYLYLDNRNIQFISAMCAAGEIIDEIRDIDRWKSTSNVPSEFLEMLENEVVQTDVLPSDLYQLRSDAASNPHRTFPLRSNGDHTFEIVLDGRGHAIGSIQLKQLLREAYVGAVYRHKKSCYTVKKVDMYHGKVVVYPTRFGVTKPTLLASVFPDYRLAEKCSSNDHGFILECPVQVEEQVVGFTRELGKNKEHILYSDRTKMKGLVTPQRRKIARFFNTTGVLWSFGKVNVSSEHAANLIMTTYAEHESIHVSDLGVGRFRSRYSPTGIGYSSGLCIYDAVPGGLRLSENLNTNFASIVDRTIARYESRISQTVIDVLYELRDMINRVSMNTIGAATSSGSDKAWMMVINDGERALYRNSGIEEVTIKRFVTTTNGFKYQLVTSDGVLNRVVDARLVEPKFGETNVHMFNVETGETRPVEIIGTQFIDD
jgi:DEAD/DEAH box helicase domain-containing protein